MHTAHKWICKYENGRNRGKTTFEKLYQLIKLLYSYLIDFTNPNFKKKKGMSVFKKKKWWQILWSNHFLHIKPYIYTQIIPRVETSIKQKFTLATILSYLLQILYFPLMSLVIETSIMSISLYRYSLVCKTFLPTFSRMVGYRYNLVKILSCEKATFVKTILIV